LRRVASDAASVIDCAAIFLSSWVSSEYGAEYLSLRKHELLHVTRDEANDWAFAKSYELDRKGCFPYEFAEVWEKTSTTNVAFKRRLVAWLLLHICIRKKKAP